MGISSISFATVVFKHQRNRLVIFVNVFFNLKNTLEKFKS